MRAWWCMGEGRPSFCFCAEEEAGGGATVAGLTLVWTVAGEEWFDEGEDIVTAAGVVYCTTTGALWHIGLDLEL